jgi:hypothetical protein
MPKKLAEDVRDPITWSRPTLNRFKVAYKKAPGDLNAVFVFKKQDFIKGYAKYLIEFLERELEK